MQGLSASFIAFKAVASSYSTLWRWSRRRAAKLKAAGNNGSPVQSNVEGSPVEKVPSPISHTPASARRTNNARTPGSGLMKTTSPAAATALVCLLSYYSSFSCRKVA